MLSRRSRPRKPSLKRKSISCESRYDACWTPEPSGSECDTECVSEGSLDSDDFFHGPEANATAAERSFEEVGSVPLVSTQAERSCRKIAEQQLGDR